MGYFDNNERRLPGIILAAGAILRVLGIIFLGVFAGYGVIYLLLGLSPEQLKDLDLSSEQLQNTLLMAQTIVSLFQFLIIPLLYIFLIQKGLTAIFRINTPQGGQFIIYALLLYISFIPFLGKTIEWNQQLDLPEAFESLEKSILEREKQAEEIIGVMINAENTGEFLMILFVVAVLPAIGEELLFRGILQNELKWSTQNAHLAIWLGAITFSFIHFQFLGFIPRMLLGALFGYVYYWSGNLIVPIILHFLHNATSLVVANYFKPPEGQAEDEIMKQNSWIAILFSLAFSSVFVYLSWKKYKERKKLDELAEPTE